MLIKLDLFGNDYQGGNIHFWDEMQKVILNLGLFLSTILKIQEQLIYQHVIFNFEYYISSTFRQFIAAIDG